MPQPSFAARLRVIFAEVLAVSGAIFISLLALGSIGLALGSMYTYSFNAGLTIAFVVGDFILLIMLAQAFKELNKWTLQQFATAGDLKRLVSWRFSVGNYWQPFSYELPTEAFSLALTRHEDPKHFFAILLGPESHCFAHEVVKWAKTEGGRRLEVIALMVATTMDAEKFRDRLFKGTIWRRSDDPSYFDPADHLTQSFRDLQQSYGRFRGSERVNPEMLHDDILQICRIWAPLLDQFVKREKDNYQINQLLAYIDRCLSGAWPTPSTD